MSFLLIKPNRKLKPAVYFTRKWQRHNRIYKDKDLIYPAGRPHHGVDYRDSIIKSSSKICLFNFDFKIYWATNTREGDKIKRKEKYIGRFLASYEADKQSKTIAEDFPDYWRVDSVRVHTYSEAGQKLDIINRDFPRFKEISCYHISARLKINDIDENLFLEKLCQHLDKIEKKFIREKEEIEDFSTVQG